MKLRLNANIIMVNPEGKILLVRLKKGHFAGGLCIPGGGIEPGELSFETAKREVEEETGIKVDSEIIPFGFCELLHKEAESHRVVLLLHCVGNGEPKETDECVAELWNYEDAEERLIPFASEAIKTWKNKGFYFKINK